MCLFGNLSGIPSLDEVVSTLTFVRGSVGSIAARYKHPLTFAIAQSPMVDMCAVRTGKSADIKRMLKPVYEKLIASGWNGWPEHAHDSQKRIGAEKPVPSKEAARVSLTALRGALH